MHNDEGDHVLSPLHSAFIKVLYNDIEGGTKNNYMREPSFFFFHSLPYISIFVCNNHNVFKNHKHFEL